MRNYWKVFPLIIFALILFLGFPAFACGLKKADAYFFEKLKVESKKEEGDKCISIEIHYPKEIPSRENWVWSDPWVTFEVQNMHFNLDIANSGKGKEGLEYVYFCLPENLIKEAKLEFTYDETSSEEPVPNEDGLVMYQVSMCSHEIVIDNLDELIAQGK